MKRLSMAVSLAASMWACGNPTAPRPVVSMPFVPPPATPSPTPPPAQLVTFTDLASGFSTSDVHDAQNQIVRFNLAAELIWVADDARFPGYGVSRNSISAEGICTSCWFLVRFGTLDGERRAYLTWPDEERHGRSDHPAPTVLDVEIVGGRLVVTDTNVRVW